MENVDSYQTDIEQDCSNNNDYLGHSDQLIDDIDKVDDLKECEDIFSKLELELLKKTEMLKSIKKDNSEIKSDLDSKRNFLTELDSKYCEVQQKTENLREMIEAQNQNLKTLRTQQSNDLIQFENDVEKISEEFTKGPHEYASNNLSAVLLELKDQLETKVAALSDCQQELLASQQASNQAKDDTTPHIDIALKLHEEDLIALNTSIINMTSTEEQLKKKNHYKSLFSERRNVNATE